MTHNLRRALFVSVILFSGLASLEAAPGVVRAGKIGSSSVTESSGLVASRRYGGVLWTHNDQGNAPYLYAMTRSGRPLGRFLVTGAAIEDWEDIDSDRAGNLYLADIGNNENEREEIRIYQVREPFPRGNGVAPVRRFWTATYPENQPFDAEAFFVSGRAGFIVAKQLVAGQAGIYRMSLSPTQVGSTELVKIGDIPVDADVTGASLSRNGRSLALVTQEGAYIISLRAQDNFDVLRFTPYNEQQMEGATFVGDGLMVSSESGDLLLFNGAGYRQR